MNQMNQELTFEVDFSHLQHNIIQFIVSEPEFIPNSFSYLTISAVSPNDWSMAKASMTIENFSMRSLNH